MKRFLSFLVLFALPVILSSCFLFIISPKPDNKIVETIPGNRIEFEVFYLSAESYQWFLDGIPLANKTERKFGYSPKLEDQVYGTDRHYIEVKANYDPDNDSNYDPKYAPDNDPDYDPNNDPKYDTKNDSYIWQVDVSLGELTAIEISPNLPWINTDETIAFTATGIYTYGNLDLTTQVEWSSLNPDVALVSNEEGSKGLFTLLVTGEAEIQVDTPLVTGEAGIQVDFDDISVSTKVFITDKDLISIELTPVDPSIPLGDNLEFAAKGLFAWYDTEIIKYDTEVITDYVTWESSNTLVVELDQSGTASSQGVGTTTISVRTATDISGFSELTVTEAELLSIAISSNETSKPLGGFITLNAIGQYTNGTVNINQQANWTSEDGSVAIVNDSGYVTSVGVGTTIITAELNEESASIEISITESELIRIIITPSILSKPASLTQEFTAEGIYTDDSKFNITDRVTWTSMNTDVITISNEEGTKGEAFLIAEGSTTISAELDNKSRTAQVVVSPAQLVSMVINPTDTSIPLCLTQQFTVEGEFADGSRSDITSRVNWMSGDESVATINLNGLATSVAIGSTDIVAELDGISVTALLTVIEPKLVSIQVSPTNQTLSKGATLQFLAKGLRMDGTSFDITNDVVWESSAPEIAQIGITGIVTTSTNEGESVIIAKDGDIIGFTTLVVQ